MKRIERASAIGLRKRGCSVDEISNELRVAKSTVSVWVREVRLSQRARSLLAKRRLKGIAKANYARKQKTVKSLQIAEEAANHTVPACAKDISTQKVLCAMMYWCEGAKSKDDASFTFTNADPDLMRFFLQLLRASFSLDERKFRVVLHLHGYHDQTAQLRFWSRVTNIPLAQFTRPYLKQNAGRHIKLEYPGCASVRYHDVTLAREIQAIARAAMHQYKGP